MQLCHTISLSVNFNFVLPCIIVIRQMKHQLDATLYRFHFCRVTLHVSGAIAHHQEYLKLVQRPLVHVLSLQVSHHISLLGPELRLSQMKHQLDATLCRFYFCRVTLHVSGACARNMQSYPAEIKPAQCCIKLVFHLTYTMMHGSTKLKFTLPNFRATYYQIIERHIPNSSNRHWTVSHCLRPLD